MSVEPLLRLEGVGRVFDGGAVVALHYVELQIRHGDCLAIVGPSGSGKSTLINILSGISAPTSGQVYWNDRPVGSRKEWAALRRDQIGIVFQEFNLLPTLTAIENVEMALFGRGLDAAERGRRASLSLGRVRLSERQHHLPHALSGGERQRVAIARSIVSGPKLILADEPTGNLDGTNAVLIADLLFELQETSGATLVLVTHNEALASRCQRCIKIRDGRIVENRVKPIAPGLQLEEAMQ
jgi:putative ABC transport system ATP-binding protein